MEKPRMNLVGEDGNVFAILGRASRALKQVGMSDQAKEIFDRVTNCGDYYELTPKAHGSKPRDAER